MIKNMAKFKYLGIQGLQATIMTKLRADYIQGILASI
jgi:hypothetical protein